MVHAFGLNRLITWNNLWAYPYALANQAIYSFRWVNWYRQFVGGGVILFYLVLGRSRWPTVGQNEYFTLGSALQNGPSCVVFDIGVRKLHVSGLNSVDLLKQLQWLPIRSRIEFKVVTLFYKAYRLRTLSHIACSLQPYTTSRMLLSANQDQLTALRQG